MMLNKLYYLTAPKYCPELFRRHCIMFFPLPSLILLTVSLGWLAGRADPPLSTVPAGSAIPPNEQGGSAREMQISRAMDGLLVLVMERSSFQELTQSLRLSEGQQLYADDLYESYQQTIEALGMYFDRELRPLAQELMRNSLEARNDHPETLLAASQAVEKTMRHAKPKMIMALQTFETQVLAILAESQQSRWHEGMRAWRRIAMLNSDTSSGGAARDLGRHIDMIELIRGICDDQDALYPWLCQDAKADDVDHETLAFYEHLDKLLGNYTLELDSMLQSHFWRSWDETLTARTKSLQGDQKARQRAIDASNRRWMRIYQLNDRYARAIGDLLSGVAEVPVVVRWSEAFARSYFPQMYAEKSADFTYQWLMALDSLSRNQREVIGQQYEHFLRTRTSLRRSMKEALLKLVADDGMMPGIVGMHRMLGDLEQLEEINDRRRDLNRRTIDSLRRTLNSIQDEDLKLALIRFHRDGLDGEAIEF